MATKSRYRLSMLPGIDVSHYQGVIDWPQVAAAGIRFAFIKATDGVSPAVDPRLAANTAGAAAAGIPFGMYHFFRALSPAVQITRFLDTFRKFPSQLPPVLDIEVGGEYQAGALTIAQGIEAELAIKPLVYCYPSFADTFLTAEQWREYPLWIAHYTKAPAPRTSHWPAWLFWQHSGSGTVAGIERPVDLDWFAGDDLAPWLRS
jgi:lysozyme